MKRFLVAPLLSALLLLLAGTWGVVYPAVELAKPLPVQVERDYTPLEEVFEPVVFVAPEKEKTEPEVNLPSLPTPIPVPPPPPSVVTKLNAGQLYVITSTQPVLVLGSRDGMVKIGNPKTPVTLYGTFVDPKPGDDDGRTYSTGCVYVIRAAATGQVELIVALDLTGKNVIRRVLDVDAGTPPVPPIPPGPNPPIPPGPTPGPVPIPGPGFRVLIVYETADLGKMPVKQETVLYAKAIRDYLNAKATPTADGGKRGWYIVDQNVDFSNESKTWQDALKRPRTQVPWIIVSNGTSGFEGPLPADVTATLELLKKYGGN